MFVGGAGAKNLPVKKAFLFNVFNPTDIENLEEIRLRRQYCSLSLIGDGKSGRKVLAVGGMFNPETQEYQNVCEIFDL
jgi:hypothetical protein